MSIKRPRKYLLLTLDAYETLFHPRLPIATQYAQTARSLGVFNPLPAHIRPSESDLKSAFKDAFKHESRLRPNYGRLQPDLTGGPRQWWGNVIKGSFERALVAAVEKADADGRVCNEASGGKERTLESLPPELVPQLLERFSSREGYELYDDVEPFFRSLREWRAKSSGDKFDEIIVGVVSNADDRVSQILRSLGLNVGGRGAGETVVGSEKSTETKHTAPDLGKIDRLENDIDFVVTSYEAGEEKPHRLIFDIAKRQGRACKQTVESLSDAEPAENSEAWTYLHVGDDEAKDYKGAINAGWDSVHLDRNVYKQANNGAMDSLEGIKKIYSLAELVAGLG